MMDKQRVKIPLVQLVMLETSAAAQHARGAAWCTIGDATLASALNIQPIAQP